MNVGFGVEGLDPPSCVYKIGRAIPWGEQVVVKRPRLLRSSRLSSLLSAAITSLPCKSNNKPQRRYAKPTSNTAAMNRDLQEIALIYGLTAVGAIFVFWFMERHIPNDEDID